MMFVSLPRLAEEKSLAGNLARHILDGNVDELDGELKSIAEMYKREFETFKSEKGAAVRWSGYVSSGHMSGRV